MSEKNRIVTMVLFIVFSIVVGGCASLRSVSLTQIPENRENLVVASVEKFIFLGLNFNNDYIDELNSLLTTQCPDGEVKGILTKDEAILYFIAYTRKITATGYCIK